jgi:acyl transferase domain-containing protein
VCIAAVNSPTACTLAGDAGELEAIHKKLDEAGTFNRILRVNIAFHSPYTEPIKKDFLELQTGINSVIFLRFQISKFFWNYSTKQKEYYKNRTWI